MPTLLRKCFGITTLPKLSIFLLTLSFTIFLPPLFLYFTKIFFLCQKNLTLPKIFGKISVVNKEVSPIKLDYTLTDPQERKVLVEQILAENPEPSPAYLEILADYLVLCLDKQEKKQKVLLTDNRLITVNRRETSFEGLVSQLESGEDGIYPLIKEDKNAIFYPKISITQKDLAEIPELRQLRRAITQWEERLKTAQGREAFIIKKTLIELRKDQYVIKNAYRKPISFNKISKTNNLPSLPEEQVTIDPNTGAIAVSGVSFLDPKVCSAFLCHYSKIKEDSWGNFEHDLWALQYDFDMLCDKALTPHPLYEEVVIQKTKGTSNIEIQQILQEKFGKTYSVEYISSLWRKKIPELIADCAQEDYIQSYFTFETKGNYKFCRRCGQVKLALPRYFSKNTSSKDGYYSICKSCRSKSQKKGSEE